MSGKRIDSPLNQKTRPTASRVREAIINILGNDLNGASWLDLCSGTGSMACEALQKGAKKVLAIEKQWQVAKICKKNLIDVANCMDYPANTEVICTEIISFLKKGPKSKKPDHLEDGVSTKNKNQEKIIPINIRSDVAMNNSTGRSKKSLVLFS